MAENGFAAENVYKWKMATWAPRNAVPGWSVFSSFCQRVEKASGGRLTIQLTAVDEVVGYQELFNAVRSGIMQVTVPYPGYYAGMVPQANIETGLPFSIENPLELTILFEKGGLGEILNKEVYGPLGCYYLGPSIQPGTPLILKTSLESLNDLKSRKIRAIGPAAKVLAKLGAKVVTVPYSEVYTSLATGVVDGAVAGNAGEIYDTKFFEQAKFFMSPNVDPAQTCPILVNMKAWQSLPVDLQNILITAAKENGQLMQIESWQQQFDAMEKLRKAGVKQNELSDADKKKMREAAKEVWDEMGTSDPVSAKMVKTITDYMKSLGQL
jgi:TRAP-type C4-dicarboxylate transport system substrate-binding protein